MATNWKIPAIVITAAACLMAAVYTMYSQVDEQGRRRKMSTKVAAAASVQPNEEPSQPVSKPSESAGPELANLTDAQPSESKGLVAEQEQKQKQCEDADDGASQVVPESAKEMTARDASKAEPVVVEEESKEEEVSVVVDDVKDAEDDSKDQNETREVKPASKVFGLAFGQEISSELESELDGKAKQKKLGKLADMFFDTSTPKKANTATTGAAAKSTATLQADQIQTRETTNLYFNV